MAQASPFTDKSNPLAALIPPNIQRQLENSVNSPNNHLNLPPFLPDSLRIPPGILALNPHILSTFVRQLLLGNQTAPLLNQKRPQLPQPSPVLHAPQQQQSTGSVPHPPPRHHEIEETGELVYSIVEGEKVMGFNVWGEVRLCLPHLLRFVLNDVDIDEIGQAISKLRITCTKCSPRQLATLHGCNALPSEVTACGLIRKSDAERMLKYLRAGRQRPTLADACGESPLENAATVIVKSEKIADPNFGDEFIDIRHDCFGRQTGRIYPRFYTSPTAACILCKTCDKLFSPSDFVGHTHSVTEMGSCCHWGFDSTNWRSYIQLDLDLSLSRKRSRREEKGESDLDDTNVQAYRALKDFKIKFLKPLNVPHGIVKKLNQMESSKQETGSQAKAQHSSQSTEASACKPDSPETSADVDAPCAQLELRLRPNVKIGRLWAPHQGRFRIPKPPKLMTDYRKCSKQVALNTGPPILLDPSCIITKDSAHLYGRDFIPNVCLKPVETPNQSTASSQQQLSRSLPSVPSNDDILTSSQKRLSEIDLFPGSKVLHGQSGSLPRYGRPNIRLTDYSRSNQDLDSIDSSPARARHSSCVHDSAKRLAVPVEDRLGRCPSVDSAPSCRIPRGQLIRTASDSDITSTTVRLGVKRGRTGSRSLTPQSSSTSPLRRKRLSTASERQTETRQQTSGMSIAAQETTPEALMNWATDATPRIPNLVSHWIAMQERIEQFCNALAPQTCDVERRQLFDQERRKLMTDLHTIRDKNFAEISIVLEDNRKLGKMVRDALAVSGSAPALTPNTLAPSYGVIPGVTNVDPITRMMNLFQGFKPKVSSAERSRQSTLTDSPVFTNPDQRTKFIWPPSQSHQSATPDFLSNGSMSSLAPPPLAGLDSPSLVPSSASNNVYLLPSKRQRLLRHSYSLNAPGPSPGSSQTTTPRNLDDMNSFCPPSLG